MEPDERTPVGFPLPYAMQSLRTFVAEGDLERLLVRMRLLAGESRDLRLAIASVGPEGIEVSARLGRTAREPRFGASRLDEEALEPLTELVLAVNEVLAGEGIGERFVIERVAPTGDRKMDYRVALLSGRRLGSAVEASWEAERCIDGVQPPADAVEPLHAPHLPPWQEAIPQTRRFPSAHTLPAFLAGLTEELAVFAGLESIRCTPRESRSSFFGGPGTVALKVVETGNGSLEETVRVPVAPELDIQPILDCLDGRLRYHGSDLRFAIVRDMPDDAVVLVSEAEAAELKRLGYLVAPQGRELLERLVDAGFVVGAGAERRPPGAWELELRKLRYLARGAGLPLTWTAGAISLGGHEVALEGELSLPELLRHLNRGMASAGEAARFVALRGEPVWYGERVVLADPSWVNALMRLAGVEREGLEPEWRPSAAPPRPLGRPPSVPRVRDVVPQSAIHESDFKCSARSEDLPDVVRELAAFARVELDVEELARPTDDDGWMVSVTHDGARAELRFSHHKYARVAPALEYLNAILVDRGSPARLHAFAGERYSSGVLLADDHQAERLRDLGYVDD